MILGTIANLEAIDEKQAEIHESAAVIPAVDPVPFVEKLPKSVDDKKPAPQASDSRASNGKRKPNKTHNVLQANEVEQIPAPVNISVRELDLHDAQAVPQPRKDTIPEQNKPDVRIETKKNPEAKKIVAEPDKSANAKVDSSINKDAIQKEEQEIAIDAKEEKQKNLETAKELLNEVKIEWVKQNEETQKLVLEKIDKISEKVNKIEHLQKEEKHRDSASPKKQDEKLAPVPTVDEHNREAHIENEKKDTDEKKKQPDEKPTNVEVPKNIPGDAKVSEPERVKDPIVESILPKGNVDPANPESGDRTGRELLSIKFEKDMLRTKRSSRTSGDHEEKTRVKPVNLKRKDGDTKLEAENTDDDLHAPDANPEQHNLHNFDDRDIEKNANLDGPSVILEQRLEIEENDNANVKNGNHLGSL